MLLGAGDSRTVESALEDNHVSEQDGLDRWGRTPLGAIRCTTGTHCGGIQDMIWIPRSARRVERDVVTIPDEEEE